MDLIQCLLFGSLLNLITAFENFESISFSPTESKSLPTPNSYWYSNLTIPNDSSFLDDLSISLHVNKFQGLLFYGIDSKFRTLWVELIEGVIEISYYNFKMDDISKRPIKLQSLCSGLGNKVNFKFSLRNEGITVICNGNSEIIDYPTPNYPIPPNSFENFIDIMTLPVPIFNNATQNNLVHFWIGNTPSERNADYYNKVLKSKPSFLYGCVKQFSVGGIILKLAKIGVRHGGMITPFCDPVCNSSSCSNNGFCNELWRGRFSCDCGVSQFVGDRCNEEYSVKFDGHLSIAFEKYFKLENFKFSFQPTIYGDAENQKLLSIKFQKNNFIQIYITTEDFVHVRFMTNDKASDPEFKRQIFDGQNYTFIIDADLDNIYIKIADSQLKQIQQQTIRHYENNLIIEHILVGDSHSKTMDWMKKYTGCFSNLMLQSGKRKFIWNELPNFPDLPKCGISSKTTSATISETPGRKGSLNKQPAASNSESTSVNRVDVNNSYMTYIAISVSVFIMLLISVIVIYRCIIRKERKHSMYMEKEKLTLNDLQKPPESIRSSYSLPYTNYSNSKPMTFKPAYKARSMTSSPNGRSVISLPMSMTPTLVTPEDEEL